MNNQDKKNKIQELEKLYEEATKSGNINIQEIENLPELPEIELYDYDKDMEETKEEGSAVIEKMAELYLGKNPEVLNHPYIQKKKEHDSINNADMLFLKKMALRALIIQLKQMDMGDTSHRNFETFYSGIREIRDIIKQSTSTQNLQETFYKQLKADLGIQDAPIVDTTTSSDNANITDQKNLNDVIRNMMKKTEE